MATSLTSEQIAWVKRWRETSRALQEQHDTELAALTDEEVERRALAVMSLPITWRDPAKETTSGLIEQQRIFSRARE